MKGWKAVVSALLVLVGISGAASAQEWSHQDRRDTYHNYQMRNNSDDYQGRRGDGDSWYGSLRNGWYIRQAPYRNHRQGDEGSFRRGDRDGSYDRR